MGRSGFFSSIVNINGRIRIILGQIHTLKNIPDGFPVAQNHYGVLGLQNGVAIGLHGIAFRGLYDHDHKFVIRHNTGICQSGIMQYFGNGVKINMGHDHAAVLFDQNDLVLILTKHDPITDGFDPFVKSGFQIGRFTKEIEANQDQKQGRKQHKYSAQFAVTHGHEYVHRGGENGDSKCIAKKHGCPCKTATDFQCDDSFTLLGGETGIGQQGNDLKPGALFCHAGKAEENGYNVSNDNIKDYQQHEDYR